MTIYLAKIIVLIVVILIVIWVVVAVVSNRKGHEDHHGDKHHKHNRSTKDLSYPILSVPSKYPTIHHAIEYAIANAAQGAGYRIVLEGYGPFLFSGARYTSSNLSYLSIEAASSTDHMGTYYGHLSGGFALFGDKGETDLRVSGIGPFNLVLSSSNTVVTVTGNTIDYPYGFGLGCLQAPNWEEGAANTPPLSIDPDFTGLIVGGSVCGAVGDFIRWFDATTNLVTDHVITGVAPTSLSVSPALPSSPLIRGTGFSVRPRANITFDPNRPRFPEIEINGTVELIGIQLSQGSLTTSPVQLIFDGETEVNVKGCLIHTEIVTSPGASLLAYSPNTWMDETNGTSAAQLVSNGGSSYCFRQNFIGLTAGLSGNGMSGSACCFSLWVNNQLGVYLSSGSSCKLDQGEFIRCAVGLSLNSALGYEAVWFTGCGTAMTLENGSQYASTGTNADDPSGISVPIVIDGQGAGTGIVLANNSQLYTTYLRLADVPFQAYTDGVPFTIPSGITNTSTTISSNGPGTYGPLLSSIEFNNSWVAHTEC